MIKITEEQANLEWVKLYGVFDRCDILKNYDMDKLREEMFVAPCSTMEDLGTAYKGALLLHINLTCALAQRIAKMISGTFSIDETSMLKVCAIMHLAKRYMYIENENEWEIKNRGINFKFSEDIEGCLKCGERSALEALNNGVNITPLEYEAIKCLDSDDERQKGTYVSIMTTVVRQANELAYALEKEKYNAIKEEIK